MIVFNFRLLIFLNCRLVINSVFIPQCEIILFVEDPEKLNIEAVVGAVGASVFLLVIVVILSYMLR